MDELIARLEKATGPDRELDRAIYTVCMPHGSPVPHEPPFYTTSIDAAWSVIPDGVNYRPIKIVFAISESGTRHAVYFDNWAWGKIESGTCATPAIALIITALKAIAALRARRKGE